MIVGVVLALALAAAGIADRGAGASCARCSASSRPPRLRAVRGGDLARRHRYGVLSASVGLSMSLGAFTVGLLLAETEYRKAIEATIEPFKGLLLGVFFISIGMKIDLVALVSEPLYVVACALGLVALKAALIAPLARASGVAWRPLHARSCLGPGGEFAFIVIGLAMAAGIMTGDRRPAAVIVALSIRDPRANLGERLARSLEEGGRRRARRGPAEDIGPRRRRRLRPGGRARRRDAARARRSPRRGPRRPPWRVAARPRRVLRRRQEPALPAPLRVGDRRAHHRSARAARSTTSSPSPWSGPS